MMANYRVLVVHIYNDPPHKPTPPFCSPPSSASVVPVMSARYNDRAHFGAVAKPSSNKEMSSGTVDTYSNSACVFGCVCVCNEMTHERTLTKGVEKGGIRTRVLEGVQWRQAYSWVDISTCILQKQLNLLHMSFTGSNIQERTIIRNVGDGW